MLVRARSVTLPLICGFLAAAWGAGQARAADPNPDASQRPQIELIIHDYLMQHPDVLIAALRAAQDKMHRDNDAKASQAVVDHRRDVSTIRRHRSAATPKAMSRSSSSSTTDALTASRWNRRSNRC